MLPILRIIPVGGVFLAIMILVLALDPPGRSHPALPAAMLPARGALLQTYEHPEWRQFLILAAVRRAYELSRLRELPGTPVGSENRHGARKVARLPVERNDADPDPDDETATIIVMPSLTIPVEIGETSSTELPVITPEEKSPAVKTPERVKPPSESRSKSARRARQARAPAKPEPAAQFNLFESLLSGSRTPQPAAGRRQTNQPPTARADPQ